MSEDNLRRGFYAAAAYNIIGIVFVSRGLSNELLRELDPQMFGVPGCVLICVWGLAYLALCDRVAAAPRLALVFALEKLVYAVNWALWMRDHADELGSIVAQDSMTGLFYAAYGPGDALFGLLFAYAWFRHRDE